MGIATNSPNGPLHVESSTNITTGDNFVNRVAPLVVGNGDGSTECLLIDGNQIEQATDNQALNLNYQSASDIILAYGGGGVGIGSTLPEGRLDVSGPEDTDLIIFETSGTHRFSVQAHGSGTDYLSIRKKFEGDANIAVFTENSRVGIGLTDPSEDLDVAGTARLRGIPSTVTVYNTVMADGSGKLWTSSAKLYGPGT